MMVSILCVFFLHFVVELVYSERPSESSVNNSLTHDVALNGHGRWAWSERQTNPIGQAKLVGTTSLQQQAELQPASFVEIFRHEEDTMPDPDKESQTRQSLSTPALENSAETDPFTPDTAGNEDANGADRRDTPNEDDSESLSKPDKQEIAGNDDAAGADRRVAPKEDNTGLNDKPDIQVRNKAETDSALESVDKSAKFPNEAAKDTNSREAALHVPSTRDFGECEKEDIRGAFNKIMRDAKALGEWGLCWDARPDTGEVNVYFPGNPAMEMEQPAPCNSMRGKTPEMAAETINVETGTISVSHGPLEMCSNINNVKARNLQELRMLTLQENFINTFSARNEPAAITIGGGVPGEVFVLPMVAGQKWMIAPGSYAASTPNVMVSMSARKLQDGIVEPGKAGWTSLAIGSDLDGRNKYGYAFVAAMGHFIELQVAENEIRHIDEDHLLAFPSEADFSVGRLDDLRGFLSSGEGAVLKYKGPKGGGSIVVQLRSLKKEAALMAKVGNFELGCPAKESSLLQKISGAGRASVTSFSGAGNSMAEAPPNKPDSQAKICGEDAVDDRGEECCNGENMGQEVECGEEKCRCVAPNRKGKRGKGEIQDVGYQDETPKPKMRLKRRLGLVLQEMALQFWGQKVPPRDEPLGPLEECECAAVAKDIEDETDEGMKDKKGLCLTETGPENQLCFRLHRGEVEVILKHHRASIVAEPGAAIFFTRAKDKGITTSLSPTNNGMYQQDYRYKEGDLLVQNVYELDVRHIGEKHKEAGISFGALLGGDVMAVPIVEGDVYHVRRGSYICGTANVQVKILKSFSDTLESDNGQVFMLQVNLVPFPDQTEIVPGIFFVGVAAQVRLHRASEEQQLEVDSGMVTIAQVASARNPMGDESLYERHWLDRGERNSTWQERMLQGESLMMTFKQIYSPKAMPGGEPPPATDRVVFTQSINFGSYARKLISSLEGCPCWEWQDKSLAGSLLQLDSMHGSTEKNPADAGNEVQTSFTAVPDSNSADGTTGADEKPYTPRRTKMRSSGATTIFPGEQYAINASTRMYKLGNGAKAVELGLMYGAVALMVTAPPPTDGRQVLLNGVGGSTVSYFAVDMKVHQFDPAKSKVEESWLSSSDSKWQSFTSSYAMNMDGQIILTQTGAEDIMKVEVAQEAVAWRVKTGHVLAISDKVFLKAEWCVDENKTTTAVNKNGFVMMVLHTNERDSEERSAWVWGYGHLRHHRLEEGETLVIDDGHLVAIKSGMDYDVSTASGQFASYLGGDALVFQFRGPGELVSQSKNVHHYAQHLCTAALGV